MAGVPSDDCNLFDLSGKIDASGGQGDRNYGGGGAGGIISIYYDDEQIAEPPIACGASGYQSGGSGFVYLVRLKEGHVYSKVSSFFLLKHFIYIIANFNEITWLRFI